MLFFPIILTLGPLGCFKNLDFSRFSTVKLKLLFYIPHCCVSMNFWPTISEKKHCSFFAVTLDQLHSSAAGE